MCVIECSNIYSKNVIAVKEKKNKEIVAHIPELLAKFIHPLLKSLKVYEIIYTVIHRVIKKALDGTLLFPLRTKNKTAKSQR